MADPTWVPADLARIERAIASGQLSIRTTDGRRIEYRSIEELKVARNMIKEYLDSLDVADGAQGTSNVRRYQTRTGW